MLVQKDGRWVFVSRKTRRPLAYYKGHDKPPEEWVRKQEQRVQYFKHMGESLEDFYSKKNPPPMHHVVRNYYHLTDKGYKEHEINNYFNKTFGMNLKKGDIEKHIAKNIHSFREAAYSGNVGFQELVKFHSKASPEQKKMLNSHIQNKKHKEFRDLIKNVTGVQLHKSVNEESKPDILPIAGAGQWGTPELTRNYIEGTPGQKVKRFKRYIKNI